MCTLKEKLRNRDVLLGLWVSIPNAYQVQALASCGYHWLLIDMEHSPIFLSDMVPLLQAASAGDVDVIVRPDSHDPIQIKRLLDLGVTNFLFPYVQSEEEARKLVQATRYPPEGIRGVSGCTRASGFGMRAHYARQANDEIGIIIQIETVSAIEHIHSMAKVPGVDGMFVGPADLAADMGHLGQPNHPQVQAKVRDALARIERAGKANGLLTFDQQFAQKCIQSGCQLVGVGGDLSLLVNSAQQLVGNFR
ncbi:HpcH/HpaI aldolase/citrate lyase family protein [Vibrio sp. S9_S30]|uniref:HpcH/HpaI aldolase family protein n=1 Tax=Vibrio sp. S9_S30 TaxID=2720226 RepID=UPI00168173A1|nr:HpcH/HpaI aldolase/citrate lyase family protein [Vibrio sp. S9_S30]MBD1557809.1 HpcH/HpaI aldolase/citrate lyase family protein [Vibrio sp. S9_S30]